MDIDVIRGDSNLISFSLVDENQELYELQTGDNLYFTVKESPYTDISVLSKKYGDGIIFNPVTNKYEIELTADCTCDFKKFKFIYDIEFVANDGTVKTLISGKFNINIDCTKPCNR